MEPAFSFYEDDSNVTGGTVIDDANPIAFGSLPKGMISPIITVHLWNGKNDLSVDEAVSPKLFAQSGPGDAASLFAGTLFNGNVSMLEARSCAAFGVAADQQTEWVPIRPTSLLTIGNMPANTMRTIELRVNVPIDAPTLSVVAFSLQVSV